MDGIPGNLGGSLRMNAGAMGSEMFDHVVRVRYCDQDGNIFTRTPAEMEIAYRHVPTLVKNFALSATLRGTPGVTDVGEVHLRWIGHQLRAECEITVDAALPVLDAHAVAVDAEHRLLHALPRLSGAFVHINPAGEQEHIHQLLADHRHRDGA